MYTGYQETSYPYVNKLPFVMTMIDQSELCNETPVPFAVPNVSAVYVYQKSKPRNAQNILGVEP